MADNSQPDSPLRLVLSKEPLAPGGTVYAKFLGDDYVVVSFWTLQFCRKRLEARRAIHQHHAPGVIEKIIEEARAYGVPEYYPSCLGETEER